MLRNVSAWHLVVLLVVIILLFGANRLPDLARSVGQSLKIFKSEVKDLTGNDREAADPAEGAQRAPEAHGAAAPDGRAATGSRPAEATRPTENEPGPRA